MPRRGTVSKRGEFFLKIYLFSWSHLMRYTTLLPETRWDFSWLHNKRRKKKRNSQNFEKKIKICITLYILIDNVEAHSCTLLKLFDICIYDKFWQNFMVLGGCIQYLWPTLVYHFGSKAEFCSQNPSKLNVLHNHVFRFVFTQISTQNWLWWYKDVEIIKIQILTQRRNLDFLQFSQFWIKISRSGFHDVYINKTYIS